MALLKATRFRLGSQTLSHNQKCRSIVRPMRTVHKGSLVAKAQMGATVDIDPENEFQGALKSIPSAAERRMYVLDEAARILAEDMKKGFSTGEITPQRYDPKIKFRDPISEYNDRDGYINNIKMLKTFFNTTLDLHSMEVSSYEENTIFGRWTLDMEFWLLPWRPTVLLTGTTVLKVDPETGIALEHIDTWDSISNQKFLSLEALQDMLSRFLQVQRTPSLETPDYTVLQRFRSYEIRKYAPYVVAEVAMERAAGPASGTGFNELAGYIFGGNTTGTRMEMTTPVFTEMSTEQTKPTMQFVVESLYGQDPENAPTPKDPKILRKVMDPRYVASYSFSGWPNDLESLEAERKLRDLLVRDGLSPVRGYSLARYNDPSTPSFLRRNEVLIRLDGYELSKTK